MTGVLWNHLWQSTWFAVAAGVLTLAFRANRAQVRYWLWFGASVKFLVPFALLIAMGSRVDWAPEVQRMATPAVSRGVAQFGEPFAVLEAAPEEAGARQRSRDWIPVVLGAAWACGFAAVVTIRWRGWRRVRAAVRSSRAAGEAGAIEVRTVPGLLEPGVVGWQRPVLLLPEGIEARLTARQLEAVVAHELWHVRRRDNLTAAVHMAVEALFWFHPLVWWIGARLVEERERACDEGVLSLGNQPGEYAQGILNVCRLYVESPLACVPGVTGADLKKRIQEILTGRVVRDLTAARKVALGAAGVAAMALPVVIGVMKAPAGRAQSATEAVRFEVASVKPCKSGEFGGIRNGKSNTKAGGGRASSPGRLDTGCQTVANLIRSAYVQFAKGALRRDPSNPPVEGGPAWIRTERYEIDAKAEGGVGDAVMNGPMMRRLLEERFGVKVHRESRDVPVYALTVAKGGAKLTPFQEGSCTPIEFGRYDGIGTRPENMCRVMIRPRGPDLWVEGPGMTMSDFSKLLYLVVDRPVLDRTGITGRFEIHIQFAAEPTPSIFSVESGMPPVESAPSAESPGPSIYSVVEKQLGLKLEPAKGAREFVVIDHVERPTAN